MSNAINDHAGRATGEQSESAEAWRITVKLGRTTRHFVLQQPPFPKVGDLLTIKGEGAEWTVTKAKKLDPSKIWSIDFPARERKWHFSSK